jgi:hypothetical protein
MRKRPCGAILFMFFDYSNRYCLFWPGFRLPMQRLAVKIMRFEGLRNSRPAAARTAYCLVCKKELADKTTDLNSRRFCSDKCREKYLRPSGESEID